MCSVFTRRMTISNSRRLSPKLSSTTSSRTSNAYVTGRPAGSVAPTASADSVANQIKKLGDLRDAELLTNDEFNAKKAELLARL